MVFTFTLHPARMGSPKQASRRQLIPSSAQRSNPEGWQPITKHLARRSNPCSSKAGQACGGCCQPMVTFIRVRLRFGGQQDMCATMNHAGGYVFRTATIFHPSRGFAMTIKNNPRRGVAGLLPSAVSIPITSALTSDISSAFEPNREPGLQRIALMMTRAAQANLRRMSACGAA